MCCQSEHLFSFLGPHLPQSPALIPELLVSEHSFHSTPKVHHPHTQGVEYRLQILRKMEHTCFMTNSVCLWSRPFVLPGEPFVHLQLAPNYIVSQHPFQRVFLPWTSTVPSCLSDQVFSSPCIMPEAPTVNLLGARNRNTRRPCLGGAPDTGVGRSHVQK